MSKTNEHIRTVTTKGQVTIPVEIRRLLGVKPQDKVVFRITDGKVELRPSKMTLESTFGAVTPQNRPEDFKRLRDVAIQEHAQNVIDRMKESNE